MTVEEYDALDEDAREEIRELARDKGRTVFSREYDTGGPAGGGYDWVVRHRGMFFVFTLDDLPPGPFRSLHEAVVEGCLTDVTDAVVEIVCDGLALEKLLPLLHVHTSPLHLRINGEDWSFDDKTGWSEAVPEGNECDGEGEFSCPFCGGEGGYCKHFLGSRDLSFCEGLSVDDGANELCRLNTLFLDLGEAVRSFLGVGKKDPDALTPHRLRELVRAVAAGNVADGFTDYVGRLGEDTRVAVRADSYAYEESGGPSFCSVVRIFWAEDVDAALDGMRRRVEQDIRRLRKRAGFPPSRG